ncbi:hypothetical protein [Burkholderia cepacia]|uniref:thiolase family protein n=1 Tax=Burkholderia cepacia TaxID=292 RepID=UPI0039BFD90C
MNSCRLSRPMAPWSIAIFVCVRRLRSKVRCAETAFGEGGTVTAGTASPLTDAAVAVLVTSEAFARQHGLDMLARVRSTAIAGLEP